MKQRKGGASGRPPGSKAGGSASTVAERRGVHASGPEAVGESPVPCIGDNWEFMDDPAGHPGACDEGNWDIDELIDLFGE